MDLEQLPKPLEFYIIAHGPYTSRSYFLVTSKQEAIEKTEILRDVAIFHCARIDKVYPSTQAGPQVV